MCVILLSSDNFKVCYVLHCFTTFFGCRLGEFWLDHFGSNPSGTRPGLQLVRLLIGHGLHGDGVHLHHHLADEDGNGAGEMEMRSECLICFHIIYCRIFTGERFTSRFLCSRISCGLS